MAEEVCASLGTASQVLRLLFPLPGHGMSLRAMRWRWDHLTCVGSGSLPALYVPAETGSPDASEDRITDLLPPCPAERSVALSSLRPNKVEGPGRLRRHPRTRPDVADMPNPSLVSSSSSSSSSQSSTSCLPHLPRKRFQMYSKSPFYRAGALGEPPEPHCDERPQFTTRGTFNPEKGKQKLKSVKNSPPKTKEAPEGGLGCKRNPDADRSAGQQLVLLGSNEFMV